MKSAAGASAFRELRRPAIARRSHAGTRVAKARRPDTSWCSRAHQVRKFVAGRYIPDTTTRKGFSRSPCLAGD
jgi:hypothetical protein